MYIKGLSLLGFRNLEKTEILFDEGINILLGDNAQGKTNILEAISICASGRSMRRSSDKELIMFGQEEAHVRLDIKKESVSERIDVHIKKDGKKGIAVNGIPLKRLNDLFGTLYAVIFSPEDLYIVKSGPSSRRRFIDMLLSQLSGVYCNNLLNYHKVLKQRNLLLKNIKAQRNSADELFIWDSQLVFYGQKIINKREAFISLLNDKAAEIHKNISGEKEELKIIYQKNCSSDNFLKKLQDSSKRDILLGQTQIGPHKDDILISINETDARFFGSQGQQRTAALSLKLAELKLILELRNQKPVLILDDVLSELDLSRQLFLFESIKDFQTILSCTGIEDSLKKVVGKMKLFYIKNGHIDRRRD